MDTIPQEYQGPGNAGPLHLQAGSLIWSKHKLMQAMSEVFG